MEIKRGKGAVALILRRRGVEPRKVDEAIHHVGLFPRKMIGNKENVAIFFPERDEGKLQKALSLLRTSVA